MEKLYIVIPAYNEEETIEKVARDWHEVAKKTGSSSRLVVIDDGSKDRTYEKLCILQEELPQLVPLTKTNTGHGATLLYGYQYAVRKKADYIFQTDSDGQTLSEEFSVFWKKRQEADAIIGWRKYREDGLFRIVVTKILKIVLRMIFGLDIADANAPYRLMKRQILEKYIPQIPKEFYLSNVMLTVLFIQNKEKTEFLPITFQARQGGVNSINVYKIIKTGFRAVRDFMIIKKKMKKVDIPNMVKNVIDRV